MDLSDELAFMDHVVSMSFRKYNAARQQVRRDFPLRQHVFINNLLDSVYKMKSAISSRAGTPEPETPPTAVAAAADDNTDDIIPYDEDTPLVHLSDVHQDTNTDWWLNNSTNEEELNSDDDDDEINSYINLDNDSVSSRSDSFPGISASDFDSDEDYDEDQIHHISAVNEAVAADYNCEQELVHYTNADPFSFGDHELSFSAVNNTLPAVANDDQGPFYYDDYVEDTTTDDDEGSSPDSGGHSFLYNSLSTDAMMAKQECDQMDPQQTWSISDNDNASFDVTSSAVDSPELQPTRVNQEFLSWNWNSIAEPTPALAVRDLASSELIATKQECDSAAESKAAKPEHDPMVQQQITADALGVRKPARPCSDAGVQNSFISKARVVGATTVDSASQSAASCAATVEASENSIPKAQKAAANNSRGSALTSRNSTTAFKRSSNAAKKTLSSSDKENVAPVGRNSAGRSLSSTVVFGNSISQNVSSSTGTTFKSVANSRSTVATSKKLSVGVSNTVASSSDKENVVPGTFGKCIGQNAASTATTTIAAATPKPAPVSDASVAFVTQPSSMFVVGTPGNEASASYKGKPTAANYITYEAFTAAYQTSTVASDTTVLGKRKRGFEAKDLKGKKAFKTTDPSSPYAFTEYPLMKGAARSIIGKRVRDEDEMAFTEGQAERVFDELYIRAMSQHPF